MKHNTKKYISKDRTEIRREEQAVFEEKWIKDLLKKVPIATIASVYQGQAFATPVSYVYIEEANAIYFHGAMVGRLRANIDLNPEVSVNIYEMGLLTPSEKAIEFGLEYESVTIFGKIEVVEDQKECLNGLEALMLKFFPQYESGKDYESISSLDVKQTGVFKIVIEEWSGKKLLSERTVKFEYNAKAH